MDFENELENEFKRITKALNELAKATKRSNGNQDDDITANKV